MRTYEQIETVSINCIPPEISGGHGWAVKVKYDGRSKKYTVEPCPYRMVNRDGKLTSKPQPEDNKEVTQLSDSEYREYKRSVEVWQKSVLMDYHEAIQVARGYAPKMMCNGYTVTDALERFERE